MPNPYLNPRPDAKPYACSAWPDLFPPCVLQNIVDLPPEVARLANQVTMLAHTTQNHVLVCMQAHRHTHTCSKHSLWKLGHSVAVHYSISNVIAPSISNAIQYSMHEHIQYSTHEHIPVFVLCIVSTHGGVAHVEVGLPSCERFTAELGCGLQPMDSICHVVQPLMPVSQGWL